jgi:hypothetical protein
MRSLGDLSGLPGLAKSSPYEACIASINAVGKQWTEARSRRDALGALVKFLVEIRGLMAEDLSIDAQRMMIALILEMAHQRWDDKGHLFKVGRGKKSYSGATLDLDERLARVALRVGYDLLMKTDRSEQEAFNELRKRAKKCRFDLPTEKIAPLERKRLEDPLKDCLVKNFDKGNKRNKPFMISCAAYKWLTGIFDDYRKSLKYTDEELIDIYFNHWLPLGNGMMFNYVAEKLY